MKTLENIKKIVGDHKEELRQKYKVKEIGIFGSYVRGEQKVVSDIDILIELDDRFKIGLLKYINIENYLTEILGVKVDLVIKDALKPTIGKHILKEVIYL